jgi:hypothetical protein
MATDMDRRPPLTVLAAPDGEKQLRTTGGTRLARLAPGVACPKAPNSPDVPAGSPGRRPVRPESRPSLPAAARE